VKSVTIQINDLFEFEGQPIPAQRPDNAIIEAIARRQFEFLRQPLQIAITDTDVSVLFTDEASKAKEEAERLAVKAGKRIHYLSLTFLDTDRASWCGIVRATLCSQIPFG